MTGVVVTPDRTDEIAPTSDVNKAPSLLTRGRLAMTMLPLIKGQQLMAFDEFGTSASFSRSAEDSENTV